MANAVNLQVRCRAASLREVRAAVDTLDNLPLRTFDAVKLAANELVANSIRHSDLSESEQIGISIETLPDRVRIDVRDQGTGFTLPTSEQQSGQRGLAMVQSLSSFVGISHDGHTHAWAEIELTA